MNTLEQALGFLGRLASYKAGKPCDPLSAQEIIKGGRAFSIIREQLTDLEKFFADEASFCNDWYRKQIAILDAHQSEQS